MQQYLRMPFDLQLNLTGSTNPENSTDYGTESLPEVYERKGPLFDSLHGNFQEIQLWSMMLVCMYSTIGLIGNSIVLYVYYFKWKKTKTRVFILSLAAIDFINCSLNMPVEIAILSRPLDFDHHIICKLSRGITFILNDVGSTIFVAVAIERWLLVYRPLESRQYTATLAKKMVLIAFLVGAAFASPSFIFYGTKTLTIPRVLNGTRYKIIGKTCMISDEMEIRQNIILIYTLINFALMVGIFILLTVLYIAIGRKIYLATCVGMEDHIKESSSLLLSKSIISAITGVSKSGKSSMANGSDVKDSDTRIKEVSLNFETSFSGEVFPDETTASNTSSVSPSLTTSLRPRLAKTGNSRNSRRFSTANIQATKKNTVMMRMVTLAFMISFTPFLVILIIRYTNPKYEHSLDKNGKIVYYVFLRSYLINSMVNPFIYGFMNARFRSLVKAMFKKIFCSKCCSKNLEESFITTCK